ncbi:hypothetical protein FOG18_12430 [Legionella israelensis]|uniref:hypothetical protein n=1 Tax=Legionella israelensis TaxID=454 RepID=UPI0011804134|nr:hypothetical protein [Legionella israelensis]QDP73312.1 hypothetical protein FOG18_12430 [Legionella israelensis]
MQGLKRNKIKVSMLILSILLIASVGVYVYNRYHTKPVMILHVKEYKTHEYPDNPAMLSKQHGRYSHEKLQLKKENGSHFTFTFLPGNKESATITFKNIDVSLMTPSLPTCVKNDPDLTRISLTDRQWNRQQVSFELNSPHIEIKGGDGFEKKNIYSAELAKNCLNAGLWEVLLFNKENGKKTLFYQGWFTFPLGHYKEVFEKNTGLAYRNHWYYLEHWFDPEGTVVDVKKLREVIRSYPVKFQSNFVEPVVFDGEQVNKKKNIIAERKIHQFKDYYRDDVKFSTFLPPGIYRKDKPWNNEYQLIGKPISASFNQIKTPDGKKRQELIIHYQNKDRRYDFYLSGFDMNKLPRLDTQNYADGHLYLMGIGTAPLKQRYNDLMSLPPENRSEFSVFLNERDEWINHHDMAIDGAILFIDKDNPNLLHMYLVSYERHAVVAHYKMNVPEKTHLAQPKENTL